MAPTLTVYGFHENIDVEAYLFCKDDQNDGYTWGYKEYCANTLKIEALTESNFTGWKYCHIPGTDNEHRKDKKDFWRCVIVQYVPEGVSTAET